MNRETVAEMIAAFSPGPHAVHENELPDGDPLKAAIQPISDTFTNGVAFLKHFFPNPTIRDIMAMTWDLVGNQITPVVMGPDVPTLTFAVMGTRLKPKAMIFMPHNWLQMIGHQLPSSSIYQMGALVFVGSQAVDFYNGKFFEEPRDAEKRARAHEAEYLITTDYLPGTIGFNDYQKGVIDEYPKGLSTPSIQPLLYKSKPFVKP